MKKQVIVHFGAGALGRGLVIPLLVESGCDVVIVDANELLNRELNENKNYIVDISDEPQEGRKHTIPIVEALSPMKDLQKISGYMMQVTTVTTSVKRENLIHVARTIAKTWGNSAGEGRKVFCCENVEHVGEFFHNLLVGAAENEEQRENLNRVIVPDTIVDRICAANWPETSVITSEKFHECAVDARVVNDTGIALITSTDNIRGAFARKRFLVNTYADAISFLAIQEKMHYLYEAAESERINRRVAPFISMLKTLLVLEYGCDKKELDMWAVKYQKRLSNAEIPRELNTVARNLWQKLTLDERFIFPVVMLMKRGVNISEAVDFIINLIKAGIYSEGKTMDEQEVGARLKELWGKSEEGKRLYRMVMKKY